MNSLYTYMQSDKINIHSLNSDSISLSDASFSQSLSEKINISSPSIFSDVSNSSLEDKENMNSIENIVSSLTTIKPINIKESNESYIKKSLNETDNNDISLISLNNNEIIEDNTREQDTNGEDNEDEYSEFRDSDDFHYLEENELQKLFTYCISPDAQESVTIHLVLYKINKNCSIATYNGEYDEVEFVNTPFIQFGILRETNDGVYKFPSFQYNCVSGKTEDEEEIRFKNECVMNTIQLLGNNKIDEMKLDESYKGFLMHKNEFYVFFSIDNNRENVIEKEDNTHNKEESNKLIKWAIVDELVFERKVDNINVDTKLVEFMDTFPKIWQLEHNGHILPFPYMVYSLSEEPNTKEYVYTPKEKDIEPIVHESFGLIYLFKAREEENEEQKSDKKIKYACFITSPKFYDELDDMKIDLDAASLEKTDDVDEQINIAEELLSTSSIYFKHNGKNVWGIKYESQCCKI